jgi:multidrug transporter EmrE-like cation transporter
MQFLIDLFSKIPVVVLLLLSASSVILGDLFGKYWSTNSKTAFFVLALIAYFLSGVFYIPTLLRQGLVISSLVWSILSIVGFLFIGFVIFHETVTTIQLVGIILGIISLVLVSL